MRKNPIQSDKYQKILDYIVAFKVEHNGNSPTFRQIADACGISSSSLVNTYLDRMVKLRMIERKGSIRMIEVPGSRWLPPPHMINKITAKELEKKDAEKMLEVVLPR